MRSVSFMAWCCGLAVHTQRQSPAKVVRNSPASRSQNVRLGISTHICTQRIRSLFASLSTHKNAISSLLFVNLSPTSTGPINTTTRYIK